ncbi:hypothetical protein MXB_5266, partial [Myxobolus squamalis]
MNQSIPLEIESCFSHINPSDNFNIDILTDADCKFQCITKELVIPGCPDNLHPSLKISQTPAFEHINEKYENRYKLFFKSLPSNSKVKLPLNLSLSSNSILPDQAVISSNCKTISISCSQEEYSETVTFNLHYKNCIFLSHSLLLGKKNCSFLQILVRNTILAAIFVSNVNVKCPDELIEFVEIAP